MKSIFVSIFLFSFLAQYAHAINWTCAPVKFADGSSGSGESFVLLESGSDYIRPRGDHKQVLKFVGEDLTSAEWQKMYRDDWGGIGAIWLRGKPNFADGRADFIAAYANYSGFVKASCTKF